VRAAARRFLCSVSTAWAWVQRAAGCRLDKVDWANRPAGPHQPHNRTPVALARRIGAIRGRLHREALGYIGAEAIRRHLQRQALKCVPSTRTIHRILQRGGFLPSKRRRWPPPPAGWYLPPLARGTAELDQIDFIEGLHLRGFGPVEVLTSVSLLGKLVGAWPAAEPWHIPEVIPALRLHWRKWGAPDYLQSDNDTRFAGSSRAVRRLGRFIRFCLTQGVVPVFAPPRETGFQAAIESFNGLWQTKVWQRFRHPHARGLRARNAAFLHAHRAYHARHRDSAPTRGQGRAPADTVIFLRRTDAHGRVSLLGASITVSIHWPHRLVRCELTVSTETLRCHALRRRQPDHQPLLCTRRFPLLWSSK
jgi:hypothetical protein